MTDPRAPRTIVLGVAGSIAAYKAAYLARLLVEDGFELWPVLTHSATRFVGALTFSTLCGRRAELDLWTSAAAGEIGHVELAHRADLVCIAPATADVLARLALGRADDPLTALTLTTTAPVIVAPAMENGMWENAATRGHVAALRERGVTFVGPERGPLASGREGAGRMAEPPVIREAVLAALSDHDLAGRRLLVTAGPTREAFDPVRFLSNPSTGKMGYALARVAACRGARVTLVSGPVALEPPHGVEVVRVESTSDLLEACRAALPATDALLMAAAPADYRPASFSPEKLKKRDAPAGRSIELVPTPDVLSELQAHAKGCYVVGFAAETHAVTEHARDKLRRKGLHLIVANDVTRPGAGFGSDTNAVTLIDDGGGEVTLPLMSKEAVAAAILDRVAAALAGQ